MGAHELRAAFLIGELIFLVTLGDDAPAVLVINLPKACGARATARECDSQQQHNNQQHHGIAPLKCSTPICNAQEASLRIWREERPTGIDWSSGILRRRNNRLK